ncbi:DoxX-like family protein [Paenibacillus algorifonticola]|uniref:DoxX-like family protein n=1 Tax=Paenibacillus algorifonticola TaxID=684063 RepID=A0A1I1Z3J4_9BACL|nr:DoxX-like family protein [Paenibacillus algorifonticola]
MSSKRRDRSIYVETTIHTDLDTLWNYTQIPSKHVQWDMRFTAIEYMPRHTEEEIQRFHYQTRIGFGLAIAGTGATRAEWLKKEGKQSRLSTLSFSSEQKLSLISRGRGYWRYTEQGDDVIFLTRYDYKTRFGAAGKAFDRLLFRPIFGWATAWSFDVLKIWLEQHIPPAATIQRALIHYVSLALLAVLWLYQGIVPKLLYPETGELAQLHASGLFSGWEEQALVFCNPALYWQLAPYYVPAGRQPNSVHDWELCLCRPVWTGNGNMDQNLQISPKNTKIRRDDDL